MAGWYVYLMECSDQSLYCGVTTDPERRLRQHNGERVGGARYTRSRRPVRLVWQEEHEDRAAASRRESAIKGMSRSDKLALLAAGTD